MTSTFVANEFPSFLELAEPQLAFGDRRSKGTVGTSAHPLRGLVTHGPYSEPTLAGFMDSVRVALIAPEDELGVAGLVVTELRSKWKPGERPEYLIDYPGFSSVFGIDIALADPSTTVALPASLHDRLLAVPNPHQVLADALASAIATAARRANDFDVLLVRLPERWHEWFRGDDDFNLRHFIKAAAAARGIATQLLRDNSLTYKDRCSVAWRLSIALYTKAGGVPWKLANSDPDVAYVGVGYALRSSGSNRFVRCVAQVFDADGVGLEFVGYSAAAAEVARVVDDDPFLTRPQMHAVVARSLQLYQRQHSGRLPRQLLIHKTTHFTNDEAEGVFDAAGGVDEVELVRVQQDTPWRAVRGTSEGKPDSWPVHRGTVIRLSDNDLLVWTQGNAPSVSKRGNFYKEGKGVPHPVLLTRYAGHAPADKVAADVLALTKMDWNNDSLYNHIPTTIAFAKELARTLARLSHVEHRPYPLRFFM
ncbi:MAG: Piwi domain-containing protein [Actinomycetota bacterium]|nr:Piwi domain-containing protein [Actinomycetota bacterium]